MKPISELDHQRASNLAIALNSVMPDSVSTPVAALAAMSYVVALAKTGTPAEQHAITVMLTNAAADLADITLPGRPAPATQPHHTEH